MDLNVVSISSGSHMQYYEESTGKTFDEQKKSGKMLTPYFNLQLVCTDEEYGAATVKLYLCSYDGQGDGFLGNAADKNEKKSKDLLKKLTDQKYCIQVQVEAIQQGTNSCDKIFRVIGNYETFK